MCGILGKINFQKQVQDRAVFEEALSQIAHRGPDDFGSFYDENISLGHRRLSIIDLSAQARQPMFSPDGNIVIIFNGEVYNFKEIRDELEAIGHDFVTQSDTEVIIHAYLENGISCIDRFNGMFSIAIHDRQKNLTYLVRDRIGIKPLYYYKSSTALSFCSEIKGILKISGEKFGLNRNAVSSYMSFRYPILNDTFFEGILAVPPGNFLRIENGQTEVVRYWSYNDKLVEQKNDKGKIYYADKLRELLYSSVKYRMISDVPIGSFLSGGVDSSVITGIMAQGSTNAVNSFTIGFGDSGYNEFEYARLIADKFETNHTQIELDGHQYLRTMEQLIKYKDAPLSVPNEVPLYLMSKELKKYITVVLSGEGADEIFGGYGRIFRSTDDWSKITSPASYFQSDAQILEFRKNYFTKYPKKPFNSELDHFYWNYCYTDLNDKSTLLHPEMLQHSYEKKLFGRFVDLAAEIPDTSYRNKVHYFFENVHIQGLLNRVDMTTMAASVEARVPFVDHRLVEFSFTIPEKYKLKWRDDKSSGRALTLLGDEVSEKYDIPKYILKKSFERLIPKSVLYRRKMGFPVPLNNWFGNEFNEYARSVLLDSSVEKLNIVNPRSIEKWLSNGYLLHDHGKAMKIWMLINLVLFAKMYGLK